MLAPAEINFGAGVGLGLGRGLVTWWTGLGCGLVTWWTGLGAARTTWWTGLTGWGKNAGLARSTGRAGSPSAARVAGPTIPSTTRPWLAWKAFTARSVIGPKSPSTL